MAESWRDSIPQDIQDDFDVLFGLVGPFAVETMTKRRQLAPFGASITVSGELAGAGAMPDERAPASETVSAMLVAGLRGERDRFRAVAIVEDVTLRELGSDAIQFAMEHRSGARLAFLWPYIITGKMKKRVEFGTIAGAQVEPRVWIDEA